MDKEQAQCLNENYAIYEGGGVRQQVWGNMPSRHTRMWVLTARHLSSAAAKHHTCATYASLRHAAQAVARQEVMQLNTYVLLP